MGGGAGGSSFRSSGPSEETHSEAFLLVPLLVVAGDADVGAVGLTLHADPPLHSAEVRGQTGMRWAS